MKNLLPILLALAFCLPSFGQYSIPTTPYTRNLLTSPNAASARIKLGVTSGGSFTNANLVGGTTTGMTNLDLTASVLVATDAAKRLVSVPGVDVTEAGYLNGVTSALQTQMDLKAPLLNPDFTSSVTLQGDLILDSDAGTIKLGESQDVVLAWDAANTFALRNGTTAQAFRVYNTYTGSADEYGGIVWAANVVRMGSFSNGGSTRNVSIQRGGGAVIDITSTGVNIITPLTATNVVIGNGTAMRAVLTATATLDYASILAAGTESKTITVTGAAVNDIVTLGLNPDGADPSIVFTPFVSAANTVTLRANNVGSLEVDMASTNVFRVTVIKY